MEADRSHFVAHGTIRPHGEISLTTQQAIRHPLDACVHDAHLAVRLGLSERSNQRGKHGGGDRLGRGDADDVDGSVRDIGGGYGGDCKLALHADRRRQEFAAIWSEGDFARGPFEEGEANPLFELADEIAHGRWREIDASSGQREIAELGCGDEGGQLASCKPRLAHLIDPRLTSEPLRLVAFPIKISLRLHYFCCDSIIDVSWSMSDGVLLIGAGSDSDISHEPVGARSNNNQSLLMGSASAWPVPRGYSGSIGGTSADPRSFSAYCSICLATG